MGVWGVDMGSAAGGGGSGKTPDQVTGLWGWWKADAGTSTTTDGVGVSQWNDSSGNARHAVQATGANQPLYKTAILNGKPVLRFDGANDYLVVTATPPGEANPSDLTIFVVTKLAVSGNGAMISTRQGGALGWLFRLTSSGALFGHTGATPNATDTFTSTNWNLVEMVRSALTPTMGHNGTMTAGSAISAYPGGPTSLINIGIEDTDSSAGVAIANAMNGDIAEIAVYSSAVSTADRDDLELGWASKYGITVA